VARTYAVRPLHTTVPPYKVEPVLGLVKTANKTHQEQTQYKLSANKTTIARKHRPPDSIVVIPVLNGLEKPTVLVVPQTHGNRILIKLESHKT
jgi:hypothetical protein